MKHNVINELAAIQANGKKNSRLIPLNSKTGLSNSASRSGDLCCGITTALNAVGLTALFLCVRKVLASGGQTQV
jgi:hypothetical protein